MKLQRKNLFGTDYLGYFESQLPILDGIIIPHPNRFYEGYAGPEIQIYKNGKFAAALILVDTGDYQYIKYTIGNVHFYWSNSEASREQIQTRFLALNKKKQKLKKNNASDLPSSNSSSLSSSRRLSYSTDSFSNNEESDCEKVTSTSRDGLVASDLFPRESQSDDDEDEFAELAWTSHDLSSHLHEIGESIAIDKYGLEEDPQNDYTRKNDGIFLRKVWKKSTGETSFSVKNGQFKVDPKDYTNVIKELCKRPFVSKDPPTSITEILSDMLNDIYMCQEMKTLLKDWFSKYGINYF